MTENNEETKSEKKSEEKKPPVLPKTPASGTKVTPIPPKRSMIIWIVIITIVMLLVQFTSKRKGEFEKIPYSPDFTDLVTSGKIVSCEIIREVSGVESVRGTIKNDDPNSKEEPKKFKVYITNADGGFRQFLTENNISFSVPPQNPLLWQMVSSILPVVLIFGIIYFIFMRQMKSAGGGALGFGKSRARMLAKDTHKLTFKNVAGIDEAKEEVQEIIDFLKDAKKFQALGGRIPKGVLLMGPPGTGKTLLAKAIAGEADVPFFSISGSDFVEMFVGVGASRVRDMFEQGKKNAPCIIFIDEIDAVGRSRFSGIGGGHDEREQTLNALLVQMDGFETQEGVIIFAATNRPDVLDPALLRPGRFDRQVIIDLPRLDGREKILELHADKVKLSEKADLRRIARGTPGFSGADLANLLNEAALLAARDGKKAIENSDMEEARDKVKWGRERRSRVLDDKERRITAYHETGHALVMQMVEESEPLHKVTIIPRGVAYLGATMQLPEKDRYMESKTKLLGMLTGLMGGRVAEQIVFSEITSGASSDLSEASRIARLMVCNWGMSDEIGPQSFGQNQELMFLGREINKTQSYSETTAQKIDEEVSLLLRNSYQQATDIINDNRDKLNMIAEHLLIEETIDGRDVEEIVMHGRVFTAEERDAAEEAKKKEEQQQDDTTDIASSDKDKADNTPEEAVKEDGANA